MRKIILISIPVISIALFIAVMLSGNYLKKPMGAHDNLPQLIEMVTEDVNNDRWEQAKEHSNELQEVYKKIEKRIQFSAERDEMNALNVALARIEGAILSRNKALAIDGLFQAYEHWDQIGN